jgi:hypothetical protein
MQTWLFNKFSSLSSLKFISTGQISQNLNTFIASIFWNMYNTIDTTVIDIIVFIKGIDVFLCRLHGRTYVKKGTICSWSQFVVHSWFVLICLKSLLCICYTNFMIQNSEVNDVQNVVIIQRANTKWSVRQHGTLTDAKVGSGAMEK